MDALRGAASNWRAMLRHGLEAGEVGEEGAALAAAIEARLRTGRPLAAEEWVARQEALNGKRLATAKPGPRPKRKAIGVK